MGWTWLLMAIQAGLCAVTLYLLKPLASAYVTEKGKNVARKEDLNEILAEVRAVTITQKEIESRLASNLWNYQTMWNQKKEIYGELLRHVLELQNGYTAIGSLISINADNSALLERWAALGVHYREFSRHCALAQIFTNQQCTTAIAGFMAEHNAPPRLTGEWCDGEAHKVERLIHTIISAGKADLGIT